MFMAYELFIPWGTGPASRGSAGLPTLFPLSKTTEYVRSSHSEFDPQMDPEGINTSI